MIATGCAATAVINPMAGCGSKVSLTIVSVLSCAALFLVVLSTWPHFRILLVARWGTGYGHLPIDVNVGVKVKVKGGVDPCCDSEVTVGNVDKRGRPGFSIDEFRIAVAAARAAGLAQLPSSPRRRHPPRWRNNAPVLFPSSDNQSSSVRGQSGGVGWPFANVLDFGAVGDGVTDDAPAFRRAIDVACNRHGGTSGTLYVPCGKTFLIKGSLVVKGCHHLTVHLDGLLRATAFPDQWLGEAKAFLDFSDQQFLTIIGKGTVNGEGWIWWDLHRRKLVHHRPALLYIEQSVFVNVVDISLLNSPQQHLTVHNCTDVIIDNVTISAPSTSPNTDGIHISWCTRVVVENGYISNGDDCVSITRIAYDIFVKNMVFVGGHGASIGSLGYKGEEAAVFGVSFDDIVVNNTKRGARIKSWQGEEGFAYDIVFNNFTMTNVLLPICINQFYCEKRPCKELNDTSTDISLTSITFSNIRGTAVERWRGLVGLLACSNLVPCRDIRMENIELALPEKYEKLAHFHCFNAFGGSRNVTPPSCLAVEDKEEEEEEEEEEGTGVLQQPIAMVATGSVSSFTGDWNKLWQVVGDGSRESQQHRASQIRRLFEGGRDTWLLDDELALLELFESC